jgi:tyrosine decarboxylase/aspartate 1-decarboxylase
MDEKGEPQPRIFKVLKEAQKQDLKYRGGRILGSMCTSPHDFAKEVFTRFIETNLGDPGLFKGTQELEKEVIQSLAALYNFKGAHGQLVTGGTEANIIGLWAARNMTKKKKVVIPETAHFSFEKACNLLNLEIVRARVDDEKRVDIDDVSSKVDEDTCAIVGVVGTTEYGSVDDIDALSKVAVKNDIHLHVDAAFGGFVLPFLKDLGYPTPFELPDHGVDSITLDPHKMGLVPIPCGCILFKNESTMRFVETWTPYLTRNRQHTIVGTRTGASAASAYAVIKHLGKEGYRDVVKGCMENTLTLFKEISELGFLARKPTMNILVFKADDHIQKALEEKGWQLSTTREGEIRIIIMPHVNKTVIEEFLNDLKSITGG